MFLKQEMIFSLTFLILQFFPQPDGLGEHRGDAQRGREPGDACRPAIAPIAGARALDEHSAAADTSGDPENALRQRDAAALDRRLSRLDGRVSTAERGVERDHGGAGNPLGQRYQDAEETRDGRESQSRPSLGPSGSSEPLLAWDAPARKTALAPRECGAP